MKYAEKLKDPRWQKKRLEVLDRDEWICQWCLDDASTLAVHHLYYIHGKEPWNYPLDAYLTICESCHSTDRKERETEEKLLLDELKKARLHSGDINTLMITFHQAAEHFPKYQEMELFVAALHWLTSYPEKMDSIISQHHDTLTNRPGKTK